MDHVLAEYFVGPVKVRLTRSKGICNYEIEEPSFSDFEESLKEKVLSEIYYSKSTDFEDKVLLRLKELGVNDDNVEKILYSIKKQILYNEITPLLLDPDIEEIECLGYGSPITVVHRKFPECIRFYTNIKLNDEETVVRIIEKLASKANKSVNIARPYVEFSLPEGHRVAATISKEISLPGSTFDIRKFPLKPLNILEVINSSMLNELITAYLWLLLEYRPFIIILGPTGSGKTTLLNALLNLVNPHYKILTIEDTSEISLLNKNWVRFIARSTLLSEFEISISDLAKLALRYRPDYMIIGEVRGKEIEALVHAAASGHGSITTFHGSRPIDAVTRIIDLLSGDLGKLFLQTIWNFIIVGNRKEGNKTVRSVLDIYEIINKGSKKITFKKIFEWSYQNNNFTPQNISEIIKRSYRLKKIKEIYNVDVESELTRRLDFLKRLKENGIRDSESIQGSLYQFYFGDQVENISM
ncbi:type II secretion protein VirB [Sulfolobus acidocaldarius SUSAZ]|nr:type II secretion protein VirB [Sulfolobus acidocaldarius SUSAZ]